MDTVAKGYQLLIQNCAEKYVLTWLTVGIIVIVKSIPMVKVIKVNVSPRTKKVGLRLDILIARLEIIRAHMASHMVLFMSMEILIS